VTNHIVETYSKLAEEYDGDRNAALSCWGKATERALATVQLKDDYDVILDMGCGTGHAVERFGAELRPGAQLIGIDPAENMRRIAARRVRNFSNVDILDGSFERIPLASRSVDYIYSVMAFHWTTDPEAAAGELARILKPQGEMDLFFIGRDNGREFIRKTTPIFLKYMGPALLLESAKMRKQLTRGAAEELFARHFPGAQLSVEESHQTYYDTLEGHWAWWVRIEGHFVQIPPEKKRACDDEVRQGLASLAEAPGIPYTIHQLHVKLRRAG
jgi:ubiquinone/menaquinone biosynthesis C-methylase UbiE